VVSADVLLPMRCELLRPARVMRRQPSCQCAVRTHQDFLGRSTARLSWACDRPSADEALLAVLLLIALLPGVAATAGAAPRTVTVAVHDVAPFVITHDNVRTDAATADAGFDVHAVAAAGGPVAGLYGVYRQVDAEVQHIAGCSGLAKFSFGDPRLPLGQHWGWFPVVLARGQ